MEKWKYGAIACLLLLLGVYAAKNAPNNNVMPGPPPGPIPTPPPVFNLIGKPAPPWSIPAEFWMNTSKPLTLKDVKGHYTLLEFWRCECSHCKEAAPHLERIATVYKPLGLKIVSFHSPSDDSTVENNWQTVQQRATALGINYPIAFDKKASLFRNVYKAASFPTIVILDRNGIVRHVQAGFNREKALMLQPSLNGVMGIKGDLATQLIQKCTDGLDLPLM